MTVSLEKFNEVYLRIKCEPSVAKELSEFFTFEVPNAKFMPSVRNRLWDGRVRLFSPATGKIYLGLLPYVRRFLAENGYKIEYGEGIVPPRTIEKDLTVKYVRSLQKKGFKARGYQIDAIHNILESNRGLILSPTGSGKSFIIYVLTRYYVQKFENKKILIVVPTTSLVEQMYNDFADYGWFPDEHCHKLYAGSDKLTLKEVVISTWQSIYKLDKRYFSQFGAVFVDECHLAKAKSLTGIMTKLHDCKYRIGTTGTLDGTEVHQLVLEGLFAKCKQITTTAQLVREQHLSNLHIKCLVLRHAKEHRKGRTYPEEMDYLATSVSRNNFICKVAESQEGNTLVLAQYIKQLQTLNLLLGKCTITNPRSIFFVYGKTDTTEREEIRNIVEEEENAIIIASYGVFSTGINIKRLHNIIFASPYKSQIKVLQSIGRGLRRTEDKTDCNLFDISDDLSYNNRSNYTLKHLEKRVEIYNQEEFDYEIIPVKLKQ
jgi:superfamily II DNA or RNA helicase